MEINPNLIEKYHEDISAVDNVVEGELIPRLPLSFTEKLFYNLAKNH
jgi:hypothetical protein